jgi:hypothetical protein
MGDREIGLFDVLETSYVISNGEKYVPLQRKANEAQFSYCDWDYDFYCGPYVYDSPLSLDYGSGF